ncbi:hypothetical protein HHL16_17290 [Pseudoflavitalea sp. G-6-1-2]|uniref:DUF6056 family protein n=1 Tax=Pseudoflavitalea sp. G-6-1-2 TaxID=2728841 RepID=UPI00146AF30D|nr:DUF6056 family protein [Pseudoflavitalea sp. G-6-1-2]NML22641.1 hypothetical protein [Pseudoflavitalea sp. G-6-1-2]
MKVFIGLVLACIGIAMIVSCFFQFPALDDLVPAYLKKEFGQFGSIHWYLTQSNGRYTTIPIFLLITPGPESIVWYPWLLLLFIVFAIVCTYWFLKVASRNLLTDQPGTSTLMLLSGMLNFTFLAIIPEVATYFYWLATSITYLFPFSLFLLYLTAWINYFSNNSNKWKQAIIISLLTLLLGGCNEVMMYFAFAIPFLIAAMLVASKHRIPQQFILIFAVTFLMAAIVLSMPGNLERTNHYGATQSLIISLTGSVFRTFKLILVLLTNPLFYISCAGVIIACTQLNPRIVEFFKTKRTNWIVELLTLVALLLCFDLLIRQLANNVIPPRAINILICITLIGCWWIIIMNSFRFAGLLNYIRTNYHKANTVYCSLFLIALLGSSFFKDVISNLMLLPVHATVLNQRVEAMETAKHNGLKTAVILPYSEAVNEQLQLRYKGKSRFVQEEFKLPPSFAYFKDEPFSEEHAFAYAEYYGIDTLVAGNARYLRRGLDESKRVHR